MTKLTCQGLGFQRYFGRLLGDLLAQLDNSLARAIRQRFGAAFAPSLSFVPLALA